MPTGGVDLSESNLTDWFKSGVVCAGIGSKFIKSDLLKAKDYKKSNRMCTIQLNWSKSSGISTP